MNTWLSKVLLPLPRPSQLAVCLGLLGALVPAATMAASLRPATIKPFSFAQKVAVYGDVDKRQTVPNYARSHGLDPIQFERTVAATGEIYCGGKVDDVGSGNLTDQSDVVITAFHMIEDLYDCRKPDSVSVCSFTTDGETISVKSVVGAGPGCGSRSSTNDWAVLRLARPVRGVTPYRVPTPAERVLHESQTVIFVGEHSGDWFQQDPKTNKRVFPKHAVDCAIRYVWSDWGLPNLFASDCDSGKGDSGSGVLVINASPTILGIYTSDRETVAMTKTVLATDRENARPYNVATWAAYNVPLNGDFLAAVLSARPGGLKPSDQPWSTPSQRTTLDIAGLTPQPAIPRTEPVTSPDVPATIKELGTELAELTPEVRAKLRLAPDTAGIVVVGITPYSLAARSQLSVGDVIREVGATDVHSLSEYNAALDDARQFGSTGTQLSILKMGQERYIWLPFN